MPLSRLFGSVSVGTTNQQGSYFLGSVFPCIATGVVKELRFHCDVSGDIKIALYADNAGEMGDRLYYNDSGQSVTGGQWNPLSIADVSVTNTVEYWIAINGSATGVGRRNATAGDRRYKTSTYSSHTWPDPAGSGFSTYDDEGCYAAWGYVPPTITDIDGDEDITTDQENVVHTGNNFEDTQGSGKLEYSDNSTYGLGTVVEQTDIDSWSDTSIQSDVVVGGLSAGTIYAWVTTDSGQRNATGFQLTLTASGWSNISKLNGSTITIDDKLNGVIGTNFAKINGAAV